MKSLEVLCRKIGIRGSVDAEIIMDSEGNSGISSTIFTRKVTKAIYRAKDFIAIEPHQTFVALVRIASDSGNRYLLSVHDLSISLDEFVYRFVLANKPASRSDEDEDVVAAKKKPSASDGKMIGSFWIAPEVSTAYNVADRMLTIDPAKPVKILVRGPSGYGKTSSAKIFADAAKLNFKRMNCASVRDPEEWFGTREAVDGNTVFRPSSFIQCVTEGDYVIVLDEFNRIEPWLHNTLYPLLDDDAETEIYGTRYKVGPRTVFVATINEGAEYTGIFELDEAQKQRFDVCIRMQDMPQLVEVVAVSNRYDLETREASEIVTTISKLRQIMPGYVSPRTSMQVAALVKAGMTVKGAFHLAFVNRLDEIEGLSKTNRKEAIDLLNTQFGSDNTFFYSDEEDIFDR